MRNKNKIKISYEPEADVLRVWIKGDKLYDAIKFGNFIIHLNKKGQPIFLEILNAKDFILRTNQSILNEITRYSKLRAVA